MTGYRLANFASLLLTASALGALGLGYGVGSLFFDDPHASYSDFTAWIGGHALAVLVVAILCRIAARLLSRMGRMTPATAVALLPALFVVMGTIYVLIPSRG